MSIENRRSKERESRRKAILAAAEKRFAREGFHVTTLEQVAADIDISKATIYLYFTNKEELLFSILEGKFENYTRHIQGRLEGVGSLREAITVMVTDGLEFLSKNHHFFRLAMVEQSKFEQTLSQETRQRFIHQQQEFLALIEDTFGRHMKNESITAYAPRSLALCVNGAITSHMMNWLLSGGEINLDQAREDILTVLLHGYLGSTGNP
ncbi:MAG: TetR/AcrR family transcriptional regulator [Fidelibacterota bacterium]|nr:MAG: TetR/AcrR family transcriptional regulator [Candidatus Neomarinimicrobiota bacterium]